MKQKTILLLVAACLSIAACNRQDNKTAYTAPPVPKKPAIEEPFKYHKMIEVAPGQYYDVLSWGRGAAGGGAYMILRSDSADQQYNSTTGDLEGPIQDVLNADLDVDGNPEIIIQAKSVDSTRFTNVFAYEYHNDNANKLDFPRLTSSQRKGYRGDDNFYIKDSKLMREFPVYEGSGAQAKPSGQKRLLEYSFHNNSFSAKQVSKDSVSNTTAAESQKVAAVPSKTVNREPVQKAADHEVSHHRNSDHKTRNHNETASRSKKHTTVSRHHKVAEKHRPHRVEGKKKHRKRR